MTLKDFWRNSKVAVIGGGSWGSVIANLISHQCREVRIWLRDEESVRSINSTRLNPRYFADAQFNERVHAYHDLKRIFEGGVHAIVWVLPSNACREVARQIAPELQGDELIIHATKGVEAGTMKRVSEVLVEELPCRRIGVMSGPNLANEMARGEPAATVIASPFSEVCEAGSALLAGDRFRIYTAQDVVGVEWAGTLKNILAIASGTLDAMNLGWNARAMLITRGLAEMVRFGTAMGAQESTFLGLAGIGDLLATCSSPLSRNYRVGFRLAKGESLEKILLDLASTAEGVRTTRNVWEYASQQGISMPITAGVYQILEGRFSVQEVLHQLMTSPLK